VTAPRSWVGAPTGARTARAAPAARAAPPWYRRLGLEVRNVGLTIVAGAVVLAAFVGAVILVTALATR